MAVLHYDEDYDRIAEITGQPMRWLAPRGSLRWAGRCRAARHRAAYASVASQASYSSLAGGTSKIASISSRASCSFALICVPPNPRNPPSRWARAAVSASE